MVGALFGGWGGWFGWGWHPNWFGRSIPGQQRFLFTDMDIIRGFGFRAGLGGSGVWAHDPSHRLGVAYPNRQVASQFHANVNARAQSVARAQAGVRAQSALRSSAMARPQAARSMSSPVDSRHVRGALEASRHRRRQTGIVHQPRTPSTHAHSTPVPLHEQAAPRAAAPEHKLNRSYSNSGASRAASAPQHYSAPSSRGSSSMAACVRQEEVTVLQEEATSSGIPPAVKYRFDNHSIAGHASPWQRLRRRGR